MYVEFSLLFSQYFDQTDMDWTYNFVHGCSKCDGPRLKFIFLSFHTANERKIIVKMMRIAIFCLVLVGCMHSAISQDSLDLEEQSSGLYQIEGKVYSPEIENNQNWQDETQLILNSGKLD